MSQGRETAIMTMTRLDSPGAPPEHIEVYVDNGELVDPSILPQVASPPPTADQITMSRDELDALILQTATAAAEAAVSAVLTIQDVVQS